SRRHLRQLQGRFSCDPECSFGADECSEQVVTRCIDSCASEIDDLASGENHSTTKHVVRGRSIFQAMNTAGTLGDVASDRAGWLARRIWNVIQTKRRHRA